MTIHRFVRTGLISSLLFLTMTHAYADGIVSKGMGDTGVATPTDTIDVALNPAVISFMGRELNIGAVFEWNASGYQASNIGSAPFGVAPGNHSSRTPLTYSPKFGYVQPISGTNLTWGINGDGLSVYTSYSSRIGGSTIGHNGGVFGGGYTSLRLIQMTPSTTLSWKVKPNFSVAASLVAGINVIEARGFQPFAGESVDPRDLTNRSKDTGFGFGGRFGILYKATPWVAFGASYQTLIPTSKIGKYAGLLPNHGSLDIPPVAFIGLSFTPNSQWMINTDIEKQWFSQVNAFRDTNFCPTGNKCLGATDGLGFGRVNVVYYRLGLQWIQNAKWTWRAGLEHSTNPFPNDQMNFNIVAPLLIAQNTATVGFTRTFTKNWALDTSFKYAPRDAITGQNHSNPSQSVKVYQENYELAATATYKFDA